LEEENNSIPNEVEVVLQTNIYKYFQKNREFWKKINYIQSGATHYDEYGQDSIIIVNFFANISRTLEDPIIYDFKSFGEDEDLIKRDKENYCLK